MPELRSSVVGLAEPGQHASRSAVAVSARRRFAIHLAVLLCATAVLGALWLTDPESWMNLRDDGGLQQVQVLVLALALASTLAALITCSHERHFWLFVSFPVFFLFWRELDLDQETSWIGMRAFSWSDLMDPGLPLWVRLMLGVPSVALTLAWAVLGITRASSIWPVVRASLTTPGCTFGIVAVGAMGVAQAWDRHILERDHPDPYVEEMLELVGEVAALLLIETLRHQSAHRASAPPMPGTPTNCA